MEYPNCLIYDRKTEKIKRIKDEYNKKEDYLKREFDKQIDIGQKNEIIFDNKNNEHNDETNNLNTIKNAEKIFFMEKGNLISFGNYEQMKNSNDFNLYINECEKKEEKKELKTQYEELFEEEINKKIKYMDVI